MKRSQDARVSQSDMCRKRVFSKPVISFLDASRPLLRSPSPWLQPTPSPAGIRSFINATLEPDFVFHVSLVAAS